jgi:hypothetical protein
MDERSKDAKDTLMGVLSYIDSPFKLIVVLLLAIVGYAGYFWHTNHELLIGVYNKHRELPKLNDKRFDDVALVVFKQLSADIVAIFTVDTILNKRIAVRAYRREGGRESRVEGIDVGLFTSNAENNRDVIELLAGKIPCTEYRRPQSEIGLWYTHEGVTFTCRVSVPPEINQFIGQITVGWKEKPKDLDLVHDIMTVAARALIK